MYVAQAELGHDVKSVEALLKTQEEVEQDISARQPRLEQLLQQVRKCVERLCSEAHTTLRRRVTLCTTRTLMPRQPWSERSAPRTGTTLC